MHKALIPSQEVDDFVIIRVRAFTQKVQQRILGDVLAGEDLPLLEWQLMFSIARFGSCHLAHVTSQTSIDPAHGSRAATALEKKGLIARKEDPDNRRRKLMSLTPAGIVLFERVWPKARRLMRAITDQMDHDDFEDFKRLLALVNDAADQVSQKGKISLSDTHTKENIRIVV